MKKPASRNGRLHKSVSAAMFLIASAASGAAMPAEQQTALVQKYCAVCHNDAHINGGLSLQHFDAAHADPGVAAMLVSKLTSGLLLRTVRDAASNPEAAATVAHQMKTGAMGAAGVPLPDRATQDALTVSLAGLAAHATEWNVTSGPTTTASILQELPSSTDAAVASHYRLTVTCDPNNREPRMLLSWAPGVPNVGRTLSALIDGKTPLPYNIVEESAKLFTGASGGQGTGAAPIPARTLPEKTLSFADVFPGETVVFPFETLSSAARQALAPCFTGSSIAQK